MFQRPAMISKGSSVRALLCSFVLFAVATTTFGCRGGCSKETKVQAKPEVKNTTPDAVEETKPVDLNSLLAVHAKMEAQVSKMRTISKSQNSLTKEMATRSRAFRKLGGLNKIPTAPSPAPLHKALQALAKTHGLDLTKWSFSTAKNKGHAPPPKRYSSDGPYPFERPQLVLLHPLSFVVQVNNRAQRDDFLKSITQKLERIVQLETIVGKDREVQVTAIAYSFTSVRAPIRSFTAPTSARKYSAAGFPSSGPKCGGEPQCDRLVTEIQKLNKESISLHEGVERALSVEAELNLWVARTKALGELLEESQRANIGAISR